MPQYLRNDSLRLFGASKESLALALVGLGLPARQEGRDSAGTYAPVIGLIGAAAEQAMAAILVHVYGQDVMLRTGGQFKSFKEIRGEMMALLKDPVPRAGFLTVSVQDPKAHREGLHRMVQNFLVLGHERAAGLHVGRGPSRDVTYLAAQRVYEFLRALAASSRIRPYLDNLPIPPTPPTSPILLIEDLLRALSGSSGEREQASLIGSLFLVLPTIPDNEPEWIDAIERIAVVPDRKDLGLLLATLEQALPVHFKRIAGTSALPLPVAIRNQDPNALPISPTNLKRQLTEINEQFWADVGTANGRLTTGVLHLPPDDFLRDLASLGHEGIRRALTQDRLTAHEAWPFIAAALCSRGTQGPCWFLVRMVDDLGQLSALVKKAMNLSTGQTYSDRHATFREGITAIQASKPLSPKSTFAKSISQMMQVADEKRGKLGAAVERNFGGDLGLSPAGGELVKGTVIGIYDLGDSLSRILESAESVSARPYWARILCEAAFEPEDLKACSNVLNDDSLSQAHTAARKAIHLIDVTTFGPQIEMA